MPIHDPALAEIRPLDIDEPETVDLPRLASGKQVAEAVDQDGSLFAFVECPNGFYWVFRESADGPELDNSGFCFPVLSDAVLDAGKASLKRGLSLDLIGELQRIARRSDAEVRS